MVKIPDNASYTGADIKAMVYLPVNTEALQNEINELGLQMDALLRDGAESNRDFIGPSTSVTPYNNQNRLDAVRALSDRAGELGRIIRESTEGVIGLVLAELSTISYSIHRETFPVRSLGSVYAKDYTRGPRTIAGSLIFTVFNKHVLTNLLEATKAIVSTGILESPDEYNKTSPVLSDQIPPFDVIIKYDNELGEGSGMIIYGVQIVNEGQVTSVNDLITENQMQFVARDIDIMRDISTRNLVRNVGIGRAKTPRDLSKEDAAFQRLLRRRNPFV